MDINEFNITLNENIKQAMKEHNRTTLSVLRMLKANLTNEKLKLRHELNEQEINKVINRELKQRHESINEFKKGKRQELVEEQEAELKVLEPYAPKQLSDSDLNKIINETIKKDEAQKQDFGKVMRDVMKKVQGQADGSKINKLVRDNLNK